MMKKFFLIGVIGVVIGLTYCSDSSTGGGGGCISGSCTCSVLCTDSGFTSGDEMDFGSGVVECLCEGSGDSIAKSKCETYCDQFGVSPENSLLNSENDKCVCDGTT